MKKRSLIIETDLGHDPDDFFAICWLASLPQVQIDAIVIVHGDPDQVAIANLLRKEILPKAKIGVSHAAQTRLSSGGIHHALLKRYGLPLVSHEHDGAGDEVISEVFRDDSELFIIGPCTNTGRFLAFEPIKVARATMQGGFAPYSIYQPKVRLPQFEEKLAIGTFNLNGSGKQAEAFLNGNITDRRFVGKNICHTVEFNRNMFQGMAKPTCRAAELFMEGATLYFQKHSSKKFHDPTAAVLHIYPEIGTWIRGKVVKQKEGWTTIPDENGDSVLVDVDYEDLWKHIQGWK
jgi:inosine-uridine nucleoside N-ribohydrolase